MVSQQYKVTINLMGFCEFIYIVDQSQLHKIIQDYLKTDFHHMPHPLPYSIQLNKKEENQ